MAEWDSLKRADGCPICRRGSPTDVIAEFPTTWISAGAEAPLPGYACVVSRAHVVEPYDLPADLAAAFWEEAMVAAKALAELFDPVKMNYEIHGNSIPHLHMHLYPRYRDDSYDTGAARPTPEIFTRTASDLRRMALAMNRAAAQFADRA